MISILVVIFSINSIFAANLPSFDTPHGKIYGFEQLDPDSYIYRNDYRTHATGPSSYLTNAIFYGHAIRYGNTMHRIDSYFHWDDERDESWRRTTKAPYFENKIPQSEDILSAALVDGKWKNSHCLCDTRVIVNNSFCCLPVAATAFGLRTLLPLNVPPEMPLIYCTETEYEMKQSAMELNGNIYYCDTNSLAISCINACTAASPNLFISDGALRSHLHIFCNATKYDSAMDVLQCFYGQLTACRTSFIPIKTTTSTSSSVTAETNDQDESKDISLSAKIHKFLLRLMGMHEIADSTCKQWIPEALIVPTRRLTHNKMSKAMRGD